jgi:hypothetical protein
VPFQATERSKRELPDDRTADDVEPIGQLVEPAASIEDREEQQLADALPATALDPEEAMHITEEPG